jgi:hypothetical protein
MGGKIKNPKVRAKWMAARVKHGEFMNGGETPEHYVWREMIRRCKYKHRGYEHVAVCKRWQKFENFIEDMGRRPSPEYSIDRWPNKYGNYTPSNCRWATRRQQQANKRNNVWISYGGRRMIAAEWGRYLNISKELVSWRMKNWGTPC